MYVAVSRAVSLRMYRLWQFVAVASHHSRYPSQIDELRRRQESLSKKTPPPTFSIAPTTVKGDNVLQRWSRYRRLAWWSETARINKCWGTSLEIVVEWPEERQQKEKHRCTTVTRWTLNSHALTNHSRRPCDGSAPSAARKGR